MDLPEDALEKVVDSAVDSSERVALRARTITNTIVARSARRTKPFKAVVASFDDDDSLVTSIEAVMASKQESVKFP